nr:zinc metalloproteinase nas-4-like [Danaus plexippus plexippus]
MSVKRYNQELKPVLRKMILSGVIVVVYAIFVSAAPVAQNSILVEIEEEYNDVPATVLPSVNGDDEQGSFFEGDMLLTSAQHQAIQHAKLERNGLKGSTKRWPNRTVLYHIVEEDFDDKEIMMIEEAIKDIANKSCLKFRKKAKDEHAVTIQGSANGCFSNVGYSPTTSDDSDEEITQVLNLSKGCFKHGTVVHEMLHTLGFYHMQSTFDRDEYVEIVWENIRSGTEHNFAKYTVDTVTDFGVPYDYGSVMHYPEKAFSKNGNRTIIPLKFFDVQNR